LSISDPPRFTLGLADVKCHWGTQTELYVQAIGWPIVNIAWKINEQPVNDTTTGCRIKTGKWNAIAGGTVESRLILESVRQNETKNIYEAVASNEAGMDACQTKLTRKCVHMLRF